MKETIFSKEYKTPKFQLVRQNESNKVFFEGSSPIPVVPPVITSGINKITRKVTGVWN